MDSSEQKGFMKSKIIRSFCKTPKPVAAAAAKLQVVGNSKLIKAPPPASPKVTLTSFGGSDGYVHGPGGGGGDKAVDSKASSYILQVKERRILEEMSMSSYEKQDRYK